MQRSEQEPFEAIAFGGCMQTEQHLQLNNLAAQALHCEPMTSFLGFPIPFGLLQHCFQSLNLHWGTEASES